MKHRIQIRAAVSALAACICLSALRGALETFATSPGVLEVRSKPGKSFRLFEAAGALAGGNPAALFSVTAQPGKKSLEEQINALKAGGAPAAQ